MLERLQKLAIALQFFKWPCWLGLFICLVLFIRSIVVVQPTNAQTAPTFIAVIWCALMLSFINSFNSVPPPMNQAMNQAMNQPSRRRWLRKLHRGFYWLLAGLLGIASLALVMLSTRLLISAN